MKDRYIKWLLIGVIFTLFAGCGNDTNICCDDKQAVIQEDNITQGVKDTLDTDNDGYPDSVDSDDDNDKIIDAYDFSPLRSANKVDRYIYTQGIFKDNHKILDYALSGGILEIEGNTFSKSPIIVLINIDNGEFYNLVPLNSTDTTIEVKLPIIDGIYEIRIYDNDELSMSSTINIINTNAPILLGIDYPANQNSALIDDTITIKGINLANIDTLKINDTKVNISSQTDSTISFVVAKELSSGYLTLSQDDNKTNSISISIGREISGKVVLPTDSPYKFNELKVYFAGQNYDINNNGTFNIVVKNNRSSIINIFTPKNDKGEISTYLSALVLDNMENITIDTTSTANEIIAFSLLLFLDQTTIEEYYQIVKDNNKIFIDNLTKNIEKDSYYLDKQSTEYMNLLIETKVKIENIIKNQRKNRSVVQINSKADGHDISVLLHGDPIDGKLEIQNDTMLYLDYKITDNFGKSIKEYTNEWYHTDLLGPQDSRFFMYNASSSVYDVKFQNSIITVLTPKFYGMTKDNWRDAEYKLGIKTLVVQIIFPIFNEILSLSTANSEKLIKLILVDILVPVMGSDNGSFYDKFNEGEFMSGMGFLAEDILLQMGNISGQQIFKDIVGDKFTNNIITSIFKKLTPLQAISLVGTALDLGKTTVDFKYIPDILRLKANFPGNIDYLKPNSIRGDYNKKEIIKIYGNGFSPVCTDYALASSETCGEGKMIYPSIKLTANGVSSESLQLMDNRGTSGQFTIPPEFLKKADGEDIEVILTHSYRDTQGIDEIVNDLKSSAKIWNRKNKLSNIVNFEDTIEPLTLLAGKKTVFAITTKKTTTVDFRDEESFKNLSIWYYGGDNNRDGVECTNTRKFEDKIYTACEIGFVDGKDEKPELVIEYNLEGVLRTQEKIYNDFVVNQSICSEDQFFDGNGICQDKEPKEEVIIDFSPTLTLSTPTLSTKYGFKDGVFLIEASFVDGATSYELYVNSKSGVTTTDYLYRYTSDDPVFDIDNITDEQLYYAVAIAKNENKNEVSEISGEISFSKPIEDNPSSQPEPQTTDTTPPVITLKGESKVILKLGDSYIDAGADVSDNIDTKLELTSSGTVNVSKAGTYYITYSVIDTAGNKASSQRVVIVEAIPIVVDNKPYFSSASLSSSAKINTKSSFSGYAKDDKGLSRIKIEQTINGVTSTKVDEIISETSKSLSSYYFQPTISGNYTVELIITDNKGQTAIQSFSVSVASEVIPTPEPTPIPTPVVTPKVTEFSATPSNPDKDESIKFEIRTDNSVDIVKVKCETSVNNLWHNATGSGTSWNFTKDSGLQSSNTCYVDINGDGVSDKSVDITVKQPVAPTPEPTPTIPSATSLEISPNPVAPHTSMTIKCNLDGDLPTGYKVKAGLSSTNTPYVMSGEQSLTKSVTSQSTAGDYTMYYNLYDENSQLIKELGSVKYSVEVEEITATPSGSSVIKKTGQTKSFDHCFEVTDRSIKDDGYYQTGIAHSYSRSGDIVTDNITGLQWQDDIDAKIIVNWEIANYYCNYKGNGWRLPTRKELISIINFKKPYINEIFENVAEHSFYWSSTETYDNSPSTGELVFGVNLHYGSVEDIEKKSGGYVRCVRE